MWSQTSPSYSKLTVKVQQWLLKIFVHKEIASVIQKKDMKIIKKKKKKKTLVEKSNKELLRDSAKKHYNLIKRTAPVLNGLPIKTFDDKHKI